MACGAVVWGFGLLRARYVDVRVDTIDEHIIEMGLSIRIMCTLVLRFIGSLSNMNLILADSTYNIIYLLSGFSVF